MIHIIGSGPGDPELITVRGMNLLKKADAVLYAGSTVSEELLAYCPKTCLFENSAYMALKEITTHLAGWHARYETVIRLHSGDPTIYGAIDEERDALLKANIECSVVPGISAYSALAAAVKSELTVPEVAQSVLITRFEGRTHVPENIDVLFSEQPTAAIYLSGGMGEKVIETLKRHYPPDATLTIGHRVSREDERIESRRLDEWELFDFPSNLTLFLIRKNGGRKSKLYDATFTHGLRKGQDENSSD
ncbi:MAG TPA: cobalt-precorrin-4/precorrin-4 C(11)-methyltransferase [Thermotogota bacterium]|nr:cobalt-precorrin-4/precorrin-4 C(11)-methyltransferase [Thermotogota bacterium]